MSPHEFAAAFRGENPFDIKLGARIDGFMWREPDQCCVTLSVPAKDEGLLHKFCAMFCREHDLSTYENTFAL